jgi:hypothetical protein
MGPIDIIGIIVFAILLVVAVIFLLSFYICDNGKCKAVYCAEEKGGPKGSFDYIIALLGELGNDGIWCIPYIGASIMTGIVFWFLGVEFTIRNFAIMWFVCFVVNYLFFSFYNHHYLKPLAKYLINELNKGHGCQCGNKGESEHQCGKGEQVDDPLDGDREQSAITSSDSLISEDSLISSTNLWQPSAILGARAIPIG